jgi:hypothetical protein
MRRRRCPTRLAVLAFSVSLLARSPLSWPPRTTLDVRRPIPTLYPKSPRTYKIILLYRAEFKYISNSDEKVNRYLAGLTRYDILKKEGFIPDSLGQL